MAVLWFQFHAGQASMFAGVACDFTLLHAWCLLSGFLACEGHQGVGPAPLMPLCRADKAQECCFPLGDKFVCPLCWVVVGITFFLTSWGPPLQVNVKDPC